MLGRLLAGRHAAVLHLHQRAHRAARRHRPRSLAWRSAIFLAMVVVIFAGLIHHVGAMVVRASRRRPRVASPRRGLPLLGMLLLAAVMVLLGVTMPGSLDGVLSARHGDHRWLTHALVNALRVSARGSVDAETGPRPSDLTVRLGSRGRSPGGGRRARRRRRAGAGDGGGDRRDGDAGRRPEGALRLRADRRRQRAGPVRDPGRLPWTPRGPSCPSISTAVPAANWHEREMQDLFGIVFAGHPDPRPLVVHDGWPQGVFPLRKAFDGSQPRCRSSRPRSFRTWSSRARASSRCRSARSTPASSSRATSASRTVGETVLHLDARLFYTHRGLEKRIEGLLVRSTRSTSPSASAGVCSVAHGLGFCEAVEQIAGVEVPPRARLIRTIALELERLYNHVGDIGNIVRGRELPLRHLGRRAHEGGAPADQRAARRQSLPARAC